MSAALTPPLPGQYWPEQKAWYAGIMRSADGLSGWHLVLPDGAEFSFKSSWSKNCTLVEGADCRFDGHANTLAMAAAGNSLAKKIRKVPGDCHLPSRAESALLYAVMPERFEPGWHWTSTQYSDYYAWYQDFSYGTQYYNFKVAEPNMFGADPTIAALPAKPTGPQFEFTGTLTRNADVRSKPPRDGLHVVPVVCMELKSTQPDGPRYCYVERPFTDATRPAAEALAKSLKKGTTVTVLAPETDLRVSVHHPLSIHPHEAQAA